MSEYEVLFGEASTPGEFEVTASGDVFSADFRLTRKNAESLLHEMAFVLGYRVEIG